MVSSSLVAVVSQHLEEMSIEPRVGLPEAQIWIHVWDELEKRVRNRRFPDNLYQVSQMLVEEWENLPQQLVTNLLQSMPRQINA